MQQKELLWWLADRASEKLEEIWSVLYTRLTNNDGAKKEVQHNVWTLCCHHFADFESDSQIGHLPCVLLFFFSAVTTSAYLLHENVPFVWTQNLWLGKSYYLTIITSRVSIKIQSGIMVCKLVSQINYDGEMIDPLSLVPHLRLLNQSLIYAKKMSESNINLILQNTSKSTN